MLMFVWKNMSSKKSRFKLPHKDICCTLFSPDPAQQALTLPKLGELVQQNWPWTLSHQHCEHLCVMSPFWIALKLTAFEKQYSLGFAGVLWLATDGLACANLQHGENHMVGLLPYLNLRLFGIFPKLNLGQVRLNLAWP